METLPLDMSLLEMPRHCVSGAWSGRRPAARVGLHLYSPNATALQLACRESREEYCHVFNVDLRVYGTLPAHPALWSLSGGRALARTANGGNWPVRRGSVRVSLQYDLFKFHNELHAPAFIQGIGKREDYMQRTFPVVAGLLSPAQIAGIKHVVVVNWGTLPHAQPEHPRFFADAEAALNDPTLDGLLAGVRSRADHYLDDASYAALQMSEARLTCFATQCSYYYDHPEHSRLRFPQRASPPVEEQVTEEEEEEAGHWTMSFTSS